MLGCSRVGDGTVREQRRRQGRIEASLGPTMVCQELTVRVGRPCHVERKVLTHLSRDSLALLRGADVTVSTGTMSASGA